MPMPYIPCNTNKILLCIINFHAISFHSIQYHTLYIYIVKNTILTIFKDYKRNYQLIDFKEKASWLWVDRLLWFKVKEMCIHFGSGPLSHDLHLNLRICFTVYMSSEKIYKCTSFNFIITAKSRAKQISLDKHELPFSLDNQL